MKKLIKIYGERNTNTNYISELIKLNLYAEEIMGVAPYYILKLQDKLPGHEWLRDLYFKVAFSQNLGWKHTCVKSANELYSHHLVKKHRPAFLTITKNPYSWLLSLYNRPYHQYYLEKPCFEKFLVTPWKAVGRDNTEKILSSAIELWNIKNRSYLQLLKLNVLNITTEEIFENPEAIINRVCEKFLIEKKSNKFVDYEKSTKSSNQDSAYYRDYYLNEKWRDKISDQSIDIINKALDKGLMDHFNYQIL